MFFFGDFNLPHIDWNIPSPTLNDCHKSFIKFFSDNIITQLEPSTHIDGNILDLLVCNYLGLDRVKFHSVDSPLTDTNDHNLISFGINIEKSTKLASETLYPDFCRANFKNVNKYLSGINWKLLYNSSKNLQEFYDEFINTIILSIKRFELLIKKKTMSLIMLFVF